MLTTRHAKQKVKKNWSKRIQHGYKKPIVYTVFVIVFMAKTALCHSFEILRQFAPHSQQTSPFLQPLNKWILRAFELIRGGGLSSHFHNDMMVITPNNEKKTWKPANAMGRWRQPKWRDRISGRRHAVRVKQHKSLRPDYLTVWAWTDQWDEG